MSLKPLNHLRSRLPRPTNSTTRLLHQTAVHLANHPAHNRARRSRKETPSVTNTNSANGGPIILEQPDAFRPPSHPAKLRAKRPRMTYGRELTEQDYEVMESKTYPYAMPGKRTLMYRFMHAKTLHAVISITVLTTLILTMWALDFHKHNRYPDLLPPASQFWHSPFSFIHQYYSTWRLSTAAIDAEYKAKREQAGRDVESRRLYRAKHDIPETTGITQWLGLGTKEEEERLMAKREREERAREDEEESMRVRDAGDVVVRNGEGEGDGEIVKPKRKVFFGIWGW